MYKRIIFLLFFSINFVFGQKINFDTHSITLNGELTQDDIFEKDFGRFDVYELNMQEGDLIYLSLKAEFFPLMIVVGPSNDYKMAFPKDNNPVVKYSTEIDESGMWYIYIAGDSLDSGAHTLDLCYVAKNTKELPDNANFITTVAFFTTHAMTDFNFFKEENCNAENGKWDVNVKNSSLLKSATVFQDNESSRISITFKENNFKEYSDLLKKYFKGEWNIREDKNSEKISLTEIEGLRKIVLEKDKNQELKMGIYNK